MVISSEGEDMVFCGGWGGQYECPREKVGGGAGIWVRDSIDWGGGWSKAHRRRRVMIIGGEEKMKKGEDVIVCIDVGEHTQMSSSYMHIYMGSKY